MSDNNNENGLNRRRFLQTAGASFLTSAAGLHTESAEAQSSTQVKIQNVSYGRWNLNAAFDPKYRPIFESAIEKLLTLDPRTVFDALVMVESQNNQFDNNGGTLTSPSYAYGAAQVLLSTAKGVAKKNDIAFDQNAFMRNEAYNKDIGYRYFLEMRQFFDGNNFLALMAYNGGPGGTIKRIDNFGEKLEKTGASMMNLINSVFNRENRHYPLKTILNLNLVDLKQLGPDFTRNTGGDFEIRPPGRGYNNGYTPQLFKYRRRYNLPDFDDDVISPTAAFKRGMQMLPVMGSPESYELKINGTTELSPTGKLSGPQQPISEGPIAPINQRPRGVQELKLEF